MFGKTKVVLKQPLLVGSWLPVRGTSVDPGKSGTREETLIRSARFKKTKANNLSKKFILQLARSRFSEKLSSLSTYPFYSLSKQQQTAAVVVVDGSDARPADIP